MYLFLFFLLFSLFFFQLLGVVGVVVVISAAIPVLTVAMLPVLGLCFYYANRYLQVTGRPAFILTLSLVLTVFSALPSTSRLSRMYLLPACPARQPAAIPSPARTLD